MSDRLRHVKGPGFSGLLLTAMVAVFFGPLLLTGRIPIQGDLCNLFYPAYEFYREHIFQRTLPLWNHYAGCGEPFLPDVQRGVFYPLNLIYLVLPTKRGIVVSACLHVFIAGIGAYGLAREWRLSRTASLLAGIAYAFNSYTITKMAFPSELGSAAWFPVVLCTFIHWLRCRTVRSLLLVGGALSLQFLAGFPETLFFAIIALGGCAFLVGVCDWRAKHSCRSALSPLLGLGAAGLLSVLLTMGQLLTTLDALRLSSRGAVTDPQVNVASVNPGAVFNLLVPSIYGVDGSPGIEYWAPSSHHYSVVTFYVGVLPIVVFVAAAFHRLGGKPIPASPDTSDDVLLRIRLPFLVGLLTVFFLYSMGKYTPFFGTIRQCFPPLQRFTWPAKCLLCVVLPLSCLAGMSLDYLRRPIITPLNAGPRWRRTLHRWGTIGIFLGVGLFIAVCIANHGRIGEIILRRYFNLNSVDQRFAAWIPWDVLLQDSLKLPIVGLASAVLLRAFTFRPNRRTTISGLILAVAFGDLLFTNSGLLYSGSPAMVEGPSAHLQLLRPPGSAVRFIGYKAIFMANVRSIIAMAPKGKRIVEMKPSLSTKSGFEGAEVVMRSLRDILYISWPMVDKAFDAFSITNFTSERVARLVSWAIAPDVDPNISRRLLALVNCDRIVLPPEARGNQSDGMPNSSQLVIMDEPLPRAYVVGGVRILEKDTAILNELTSGSLDLLTAAIMDRKHASTESWTNLCPQRVKHRIKHLRYGLNSLEILVESSQPGLLVVSDTFSPGWVATVNHRKAPIYEVNYAFRGLRIPEGSSTVKMTYEPPLLRLGMAISMITLIGVVIAALPRREAGRMRNASDDAQH